MQKIAILDEIKGPVSPVSESDQRVTNRTSLHGWPDRTFSQLPATWSLATS